MWKIICGNVIHVILLCLEENIWPEAFFLMALGNATMQMIVFRKLFRKTFEL